MVRTGVPARPYSVISPPVSGWLISTDRPVYRNVPTPLSDRLPRVTRGVARPGRRNPLWRWPSASKNWRRSRPLGASAMTNVPSEARSNAVGSITRPSSPPMATSLRLVAPAASMP